MEKYGGGDGKNVKWLVVGTYLPGRTGKQCRERYALIA